MKKIIEFLKSIFEFFPTHICSHTDENKTTSLYVRRKLTKKKYNVVAIHHETGAFDGTYSELITQEDNYEDAIKAAKDMCKG